MRSYLCGHALVLIQCHTPTNIARHTHSIRSASLPLTDTHTHLHTKTKTRLSSAPPSFTQRPHRVAPAIMSNLDVAMVERMYARTDVDELLNSLVPT